MTLVHVLHGTSGEDPETRNHVVSSSLRRSVDGSAGQWRLAAEYFVPCHAGAAASGLILP